MSSRSLFGGEVDAFHLTFHLEEVSGHRRDPALGIGKGSRVRLQGHGGRSVTEAVLKVEQRCV
ncbi:MAG: hypothetical protein ACLPYS_19235, partial [Vulcanimicrobiaceae bacterium]